MLCAQSLLIKTEMRVCVYSTMMVIVIDKQLNAALWLVACIQSMIMMEQV